MFGFKYSLEYVCSLHIIESPHVDMIGPTPEGTRIHAFLDGGRVEGEKLNGIIRKVGGAGFSLFRPDDVCDINLRMCLEMHDGALIYLQYSGVFDMGPGGTEKLMAGQMKGKHPMRTVPRMLTSDPRYEWVNRTQFVGIGEIDFDAGVAGVVQYDIYALK